MGHTVVASDRGGGPPGGRPGRLAHVLALVLSAATLVLIVAGGLVTNTGAGLAVPDWPTTFGHNMFLFPWSRMVEGVLFEHSHRLLGALVGLLTVSFAVTVWLTDRSPWLRGLALAAVLLVCLQGLLGGLRVVLLRDVLAIVHGCLAQAFFALTAAVAAITAPGWAGSAGVGTRPRPPGLGFFALGGAAALYLQIVLGALATHAGWVNLHIAWAAVAVVAAGLLAGRLISAHEAGWRTLGRAMAALTGVQVALGLGAYVVRFTALGVPGGEAVVVGLPVAHRAVAAVLFALAVVVLLRAWRWGPTGPGAGRAAVRAGLAADGPGRRVTA
ncbi:MAG TPA: COX15/CtaA family protein [Methylomirabilota bacterium]|nr:COX15/CtaA family protein [Methylomirabilota bacterium]